ncbi:hypothetical protein PGB90_007019 [Kerria lacca]
MLNCFRKVRREKQIREGLSFRIMKSGALVKNDDRTDDCPDRIRPAEKFYTCDADGCVKLRESYEVVEEPILVTTLMKQKAEQLANKTAIVFRENNEWNAVSFAEYFKNVRTIAKAFLKLGLERYHGVCILGNNSEKWAYSYLAAIMAGGQAVGIYPTNSPQSCLHCLQKSSANIIVVENDEQLQKILLIKNQTPCLKIIIQYSGTPTDPSVLSWKDVTKIGKKESEEKLDHVIETLAVNECCSLVFTSGTVGIPKAVMLSHDNLIFESKVMARRVNTKDYNFRFISFLPLSHIAAQMTDILYGLILGACVYFPNENILKANLIEYVKYVRPTFFFGVPRIYEKIAEAIQTAEKNSSSTLKRMILKKAKSVATDHHKAIMEGYDRESLLYKFFRAVLFSKIKKSLGFDECIIYFCGGAPLSSKIREFLMSFDFPISEVYGMSECTGAQIVGLDANAAAKTLPGIRTKIYNPDDEGFGEVCLRGRNIFMGYLNDLPSTKQLIDEDDWMHTGDVGKFYNENQLMITGRLKEILITAGGENVAAVPIEMDVKFEIPVISQAVLIADNKKYVTILFTLKCTVESDTGMPLDELTDVAKKWCNSIGCTYEKVSEIITYKPPSIYNAIQEGIDRVNSRAISNAQKIKKFTILPKDFSIITGELILRREKIDDKEIK